MECCWLSDKQCIVVNIALVVSGYYLECCCGVFSYSLVAFDIAQHKHTEHAITKAEVTSQSANIDKMTMSNASGIHNQ